MKAAWDFRHKPLFTLDVQKLALLVSLAVGLIALWKQTGWKITTPTSERVATLAGDQINLTAELRALQTPVAGLAAGQSVLATKVASIEENMLTKNDLAELVAKNTQ